MISIKEAKSRSRVLQTFLKEQSVELPYGVVLEAIARLEQHKNWATFLVAANQVDDQVKTLEEIKYWPRFVLFFDERSENSFDEVLFVLPNGTTLENAEMVGYGGRIDDDMGVPVPDGFTLNSKVVVTAVTSSVPEIAKYGMPSFSDERAAAYFREELGCAAIDNMETDVTDTGDSSSAKYWFEVRVEPAYAQHLLNLLGSPVPEKAPPLSDEELTEAAYQKVFLRVFTDTNDQPVTSIMNALQRGTGIATNAEYFLQQKVDPLIVLNGPYELLEVKVLLNRLKALAKTEYEKMQLDNRCK